MNNTRDTDAQLVKRKTQPKPTNEIDIQYMTTIPFISGEYMSDDLKFKFRDYEFAFEDVVETYSVFVVDKKTKKRKKVDKTRRIRRPLLDKDGNRIARVKRDYYSAMEIFTQDMRLGNLNKDERFYITYHIQLCVDTLTVMPESFHKPALLMLSRAVSELETSASKGGFLRRMFNTFFQHSSVKEDRPPTRRGLFGLGKKKNNEG